MKKSTIFTSFTLAAALLFMGTSAALAEISAEHAKEIALNHAGVHQGEVNMIKVERDFDHGIYEYEIEFWKNGTEYDYTINADTGAIIKQKQEMKYHHNTPINNGQMQGARISSQQATNIALSHANLTNDQIKFLSCKPKVDDGREIYDIKFWKGFTEYEYEIDAITGNVLEFDYSGHHGTAP